MSKKNEIWEEISMGIIIGLPKYKVEDAIFVAIDRLIRYVHLWNEKYI